MSNLIPFAEKTKNQIMIDLASAYQLTISNLQGATSGKLSFRTDETSEAEYLERYQKNQSYSAIVSYWVLKSMVLHLYEEYDEALRCALRAEKLLDYVKGAVPPSVEHNFYHSLSLAALYPQASTKEKKQYMKKLRANQKQMKIWADSCPENFEHMFLLVEAEITRVGGKVNEALELYDKAIESAGENEFIHLEALANELAAKFWQGQRKEEFASVYMRRAHEGYKRWGATRKVEDLENKYPHLLAEPLDKYQDTPSLDIHSVMKTSQVISGEIVLDELLAKLMKIVIENAGAETGSLILVSDDGLLIEAFGTAHVTVIQSIPVENGKGLSPAIVNYVARTQEYVVLDNAAREGDFVNDLHIRSHRTKSVLCMPILHTSRLIGILYLENNLISSAFTAERQEVLKVLAGQATISLQNAELYSNLEQEITVHKSAELEVMKKSEELESFVYTASHDLKTPLVSLHLLIGTLMEENEDRLTTDSNRLIERVFTNIDHMETLIKGLREISQIGKISGPVVEIKLKELFEELAGKFELNLKESNIKLNFKAKKDCTVQADENQIIKVMDNLMTNAIKFMGDTNNPKIELSCFNRGKSRVQLCVKDNGVGIDPKYHEKIFELFQILDAGFQSEGTGVGLALVKKTIETSGGRIWVESELGKGSEFWVELPG